MSVRKCLNHNASWAVKAKATYSASAVETCLLLAPPAHGSTTNLEHVSRCGLSVIMVTSPVCIRISHTVAVLLGFKDKPQVTRALQVSHDPLHCDPVTSSGISRELGNIADCIRNVGSSSHRQIQQTSNCRLIDVLIKWFIRFSGFQKLVAWVNWSRADFGILHSKFLQDELGVRRLSDLNTASCFILNNLHPKKVMKFSQVLDVKSCSELFLHFS